MAKRQSRRQRRDAAVRVIDNDYIQPVDKMIEAAPSTENDTLNDEEVFKFKAIVKEQLNTGDVDTSEFEELKSELEDWRDAIPENLQGGSKYEELEEAIAMLEDGISMLESAEAPNADDFDFETHEGIGNFVEELEEYKNQLEEAIGSLEEVSFPGMRS